MIRTATSEEFPQLLDIQVACILDLTETYSPDEIEAWTGYIEREGSERYAAYNNRVFVDEDKPSIVGFVSWSHNQPEHSAAIECLYTLKAYRGQGIGRLLLQEAEARIPTGTIIGIRSTLNARSFYENNGYSYIADATSRAGFAIELLEKRQGSRA